LKKKHQEENSCTRITVNNKQNYPPITWRKKTHEIAFKNFTFLSVSLGRQKEAEGENFLQFLKISENYLQASLSV